MHAYRDAFRRSADAFPLVPTEIGEAEGTDALLTFIIDVLDHVASQVTQHERSRHWHDSALLNSAPGN